MYIHLRAIDPHFALQLPHARPTDMAKEKSEKKEKKSKTVTETVDESIVTGEDVDMEDVVVAKVCPFILLVFNPD